MKNDGFTLIEVVFVMLVLMFGCLALAQASTAALHHTSVAGRQDVRWVTVQRWTDSLTVRGHGNVTAGADTIDAVAASWTVDSIAPDLERVTVAVAAAENAGGWQDTLILHLYR